MLRPQLLSLPCTNVQMLYLVLNDNINKSHESFYWCFVHVDSKLKMIRLYQYGFDKSGKCQTQNNVMKFGDEVQILLIAGSFLLLILIKNPALIFFVHK